MNYTIAHKMSWGLLLLMILNLDSFAQRRKADRDTEEWRYEIEAVDVGVTGTDLIKVWSYSRNPDIAVEQAKKNAIHGIVFRGFAGSGRISGKKALVTDASIETAKADYFKDFFADGGRYMKFVSLTGDGMISADDRLKVGKEYKIGVLVSVKVADLRKELENAGIIKSLSSGF
ncbi:MAG: hypothetical protein RL732_1178 [Bacteroidota bacterium]|jgi:hypothetical protein